MSASPLPAGALADSALRVTAKDVVSEGVVALT